VAQREVGGVSSWRRFCSVQKNLRRQAHSMAEESAPWQTKQSKRQIRRKAAMRVLKGLEDGEAAAGMYTRHRQPAAHRAGGDRNAADEALARRLRKRHRLT